jgi:predicted amidohydrolase
VKIALVQTRPVKGDIAANIADHKRMIGLALENSAELIVFPELSVTGYEPELAKELAVDHNDPMLEDFQNISDNNNCVIAVGMPVRQKDGITIGLFFFQPGQSRKLYSKKYLHADEEPFFVSGGNFPVITIREEKISPAICYELSIDEHAADAHGAGGDIYIASVAKTPAGMQKALERLAAIARDHSMTVLTTNCVGHCDNSVCGGRSSAWNNKGDLLGELGAEEEGILLVDTLTQKIMALRY